MRKGVSEIVWIIVAVVLVLALLAVVFIFSDRFQVFAREHIRVIGNVGEGFAR